MREDALNKIKIPKSYLKKKSQSILKKNVCIDLQTLTMDID